MTAQPSSLASLRILLVEDDAMVSMMIEEALYDLNCASVTTASTVDTGLQAIRAHKEAGGGTIDGVLLDLHLQGHSALPVAEGLFRERLPFIVVSGGGTSPADPLFLTRAPRLTKPFTVDGLARCMAEVFLGSENSVEAN